MNVFESVTEYEIKKLILSIVKIMWSEPHSYQRAEKLSSSIF